MSLKADGKVIQSINVGKKKIVLHFFDTTKLEITPNTYSEFKLYINKSLTNEKIEQIKNRNALDKHYQYAFNYAIKSIKSEKQIRDKLISRGANKNQIDFIISELNKYSLISEDYLIKDYIEYANYKKYGENKIKDELLKKGVSIVKINNLSFDNFLENEKAYTLLISLEKRYSKLSYSAKKKHVYDCLLRHGFTLEVVNNVINELSPTNHDIELDNLRKEYRKVYARYIQKYKSKELDTKVINYLLSKGYSYKDILIVKGEKIDEMG